jgi:hypothetical protein
VYGLELLFLTKQNGCHVYRNEKVSLFREAWDGLIPEMLDSSTNSVHGEQKCTRKNRAMFSVFLKKRLVWQGWN